MDIWGVIVIILNGFWLFLPAMLPNSAAVVFGKMGKTKIDFGKSWRGKRIFGDGKSWAGLFGGGFSGIFLGLILIGISALFGSPDYWGYGGFWANIGILACLSFGAILGDLMAAFIKRRLGLERGAKAPILDQYDFVFGSFLFLIIFDWNFFYDMYIEGYHWIALVFLLLIIWFLHRGTNILGYKIGVKDQPW